MLNKVEMSNFILFFVSLNKLKLKDFRQQS